MNRALHLFTCLCLFICVQSLNGQPLSVDIFSVPPACFGDADGYAIATASGGTIPYSYLWSTGETTGQISNLGPGTYYVTVTDGAQSTVVDSVDFPFSPELLVDIDLDDVCDGTSDLTALPAGGTAPYWYHWSTGSNQPTITDVTPGQYCVTVTDDLLCETVACVTAPVGLQVALDVEQISCANVCDGYIAAIPIGGTWPFTYEWTDGQTDSLVVALHPGVYEVTVTDANGCTAITSTDIIEPPAIEIDFTAPVLPCGSGPIGTAMANVSGGTPPYVIYWSNGQNGPVATDLEPGIPYLVNVFDANDCFATAQVIVETETSIEVSVFTLDTPCGDPPSGAAFSMVSDGTPPYTYEWSNGATTSSIMDLLPGVYTVTVTDVNGCIGLASGMVEEIPADINLTFTDQAPSSCAGTDGFIAVSAVGGTPPYTYLWDTGDTGDTLSGLNSGLFFVTVTDANNCPVVGMWELENDNILDLEIQQVGDCEGETSLTAVPLEGLDPYSYTWNTGETTATIFPGTSGTYFVDVVDAEGCEGSDTIEVELLPGPAFELAGVNPDCHNAATGSVEVLISDTLNVTYLWNTGETTGLIDNLPAGTYAVTVTDTDTGCSAANSISLSEPDSLYVQISGTDPTCAGFADGSVQATGFGGTSPYTFEWNTGDTGAVVNNLPAGSYEATVIDAEGCMAVSETLVLTEPDTLTLELVVEQPDCLADADGSLTALPDGGTSPYTYLWNTGDTTATIDSLMAGFYEITVTDANGCTADAEVELVDGASPTITITTIDPSCTDDSDGSVLASASDATPPYSYLWDTGDTTAEVTDLPAGTYTVTATDANGCSAEASATLTDPPVLEVTISVLTQPCPATDGGSLEAIATGGTSPYTYLWSTGDTDAQLTGLPAGTYEVTATDANGCEATASVNLIAEDGPTVTIEVLGSSCLGGATGSAEAIASGGTGSYTYLWSNGETTATATMLPGGPVSVTVTDANGCEAVADATVPEDPDALSCEAYVVQEVSTPNGTDGAVGVNDPLGQTGPFSYLWSTGDTTQIVSDLSPGVYEVTVTDESNGCISVCSVELINPACVGDFVWEDYDQNGQQDPGEPGIPDVPVELSGFDMQGNVVNLFTTTDADGYYSFCPIPPGMYQIIFTLPPTLVVTDYFFTIQDAGTDDTIDSDADPNTGATIFFTLDPGETDLTWDAGMYTLCVNVDDPGEICCDQYLCGPGNDPGLIFETEPPTGGVGDLEFLWMYSTEPGPFDPGTWIIIPNSDVPEYDPPVLYETTYFARCVRREDCIEYLESNIITIEVGTEAVAMIEDPGTVCVDEAVIISGFNNGPGASYSWDFDVGANPPTSTQVSTVVTWSNFGLKTIELTVQNNDCISMATLDIIVSDSDIICPDQIADDPISFDFPNGNLTDDPDSRSADSTTKPTFALYPNPAGDHCYLHRETTDEVWQVELLDYSGRSLQARIWASGTPQMRLDLADLPAGVYLVRIRDAAGFTQALRLVH